MAGSSAHLGEDLSRNLDKSERRVAGTPAERLIVPNYIKLIDFDTDQSEYGVGTRGADDSTAKHGLVMGDLAEAGTKAFAEQSELIRRNQKAVQYLRDNKVPPEAPRRWLEAFDTVRTHLEIDGWAKRQGLGPTGNRPSAFGGRRHQTHGAADPFANGPAPASIEELMRAPSGSQSPVLAPRGTEYLSGDAFDASPRRGADGDGDAGGAQLGDGLMVPIGSAYLCGLIGGGAAGAVQGFRMSSHQAHLPKLRMNAMLNHTARSGSRWGNMLGATVLLAKLVEKGASTLRGEDDEWNFVIGSSVTGILWKSYSGFIPSMRFGVYGAVVGTILSSATRSQQDSFSLMNLPEKFGGEPLSPRRQQPSSSYY